MNRKRLLLFAAIAGVALFSLRGKSGLSTEQAREYLEAGALLVDVRTAEEFAARNVPGAVNIPLNVVKSNITNYVAEKSEVVLLHCRSGRRSGIAQKELTAMGYLNVFNIGSFEQAEKVTSSDSSP